MSQRDFVALAAIYKAALDRGADFERFVIVKIIVETAAYCRETYPRFNRDRFYRAAGVPHLADN